MWACWNTLDTVMTSWSDQTAVLQCASLGTVTSRRLRHQAIGPTLNRALVDRSARSSFQLSQLHQPNTFYSSRSSSVIAWRYLGHHRVDKNGHKRLRQLSNTNLRASLSLQPWGEGVAVEAFAKTSTPSTRTNNTCIQRSLVLWLPEDQGLPVQRRRLLYC